MWMNERLEHVSEFKYLGCIQNESGTDDADYHMKRVSEKKFAGDIKSLQLES